MMAAGVSFNWTLFFVDVPALPTFTYAFFAHALTVVASTFAFVASIVAEASTNIPQLNQDPLDLSCCLASADMAIRTMAKTFFLASATAVVPRTTISYLVKFSLVAMLMATHRCTLVKSVVKMFFWIQNGERTVYYSFSYNYHHYHHHRFHSTTYR